MKNLPTSKRFERYLQETRKVTKKTLRNYRSDLNHFIGWATLHLKSRGEKINQEEDLIPRLSSFLIAHYKGYHLENKIPASTTNRRLSTLRNFTSFLLEERLIEENPTTLIANIKDEAKDSAIGAEKILEDFERHLKEEGVSKTTIKNYLSDIRHFLAWAPGQEAQAGNSG